MTIERSLSRSLSAISPPVKPTRIENGPVIRSEANMPRRYVSCFFCSSGIRSIVDQNGAAMTDAVSSKVSFFLRTRKSMM